MTRLKAVGVSHMTREKLHGSLLTNKEKIELPAKLLEGKGTDLVPECAH